MLVSNRQLLLAAGVFCAGSGFLVADDTVKTRSVEVDSFTLNVPENWKQTKPTPIQARFRKAQFEIPAAEGDSEPGELVVFYFGAQGGGGVDANIQRWVGQFDASGRKSKVTTGESELGKYVFVDITGTYNKSVGPPIRQQTKAMPGSRMLSVILRVAQGGNYFVRLTGPEQTVTDAADALRASFGADAKKEKDYE